MITAVFSPMASKFLVQIQANVLPILTLHDLV